MFILRFCSTLYFYFFISTSFSITFLFNSSGSEPIMCPSRGDHMTILFFICVFSKMHMLILYADMSLLFDWRRLTHRRSAVRQCFQHTDTLPCWTDVSGHGGDQLSVKWSEREDSPRLDRVHAVTWQRSPRVYDVCHHMREQLIVTWRLRKYAVGVSWAFSIQRTGLPSNPHARHTYFRKSASLVQVCRLPGLPTWDAHSGFQQGHEILVLYYWWIDPQVCNHIQLRVLIGL